MNILEQLKENEKPFGLMSEEMRAKQGDMEKSDFQVFRNGAWMNYDASFPGCNSFVYRLRPDYEDEPEIVECEIIADGNGKFHYNRPDGITNCSLSTAVNCPDFIGFKFEDGTVFGLPVKYSVPGVTTKGYYAFYDDIKTSQALEHHATHVLFRQKKQE